LNCCISLVSYSSSHDARTNETQKTNSNLYGVLHCKIVTLPAFFFLSLKAEYPHLVPLRLILIVYSYISIPSGYFCLDIQIPWKSWQWLQEVPEAGSHILEIYATWLLSFSNVYLLNLNTALYLADNVA
jgi:hypothetical protein